MRNYSQRMCIGALCALTLIGQMAVRAEEAKQEPAKPAMLSQTVKAGETARYKSILVVTTPNGETNVISNEKHTIKEIKDNGEVLILLEDEGTKVESGGMEQEFPASPPVTLTLTKHNKLLSYKPKMDEPGVFSVPTLHLLTMIDRIVFPEKQVKPDDSWTTEADNPAVKEKKVKIKTTYVGTDKREDKPVWKFKQTLEADVEGDTKMTAEATILLDASNGQLIESEQTVKGAPSQFGALDWKGKLQRLKPDAEKEKKPAAP